MDETEARCTEIAQRLGEIDRRLAELEPPATTTPLERLNPRTVGYMITAAIEKEERELRAERGQLEGEKRALDRE